MHTTSQQDRPKRRNCLRHDHKIEEIILDIFVPISVGPLVDELEVKIAPVSVIQTVVNYL
jgi:hypothetical protein